MFNSSARASFVVVASASFCLACGMASEATLGGSDPVITHIIGLQQLGRDLWAEVPADLKACHSEMCSGTQHPP